jgi:hypothetical protein
LKHVGAPTDESKNLFLLEVFGYDVVNAFTNDAEKVSRANARNIIFAYHVPPSSSGSESDSLSEVLVPVYQRVKFPEIVPESGNYEFRSGMVGFPFLVRVPRRVSYKELHFRLEERVKDFVRVQDEGREGGEGAAKGSGEGGEKAGEGGGSTAPPKQKFPSPEETLKNFEISTIDIFSEASERIPNYSETFKIPIATGTALSVDWCLQGMKFRRYKKIEFTPMDVLAPFGGDEKKKLELVDCLRAFVQEEVLSKHDTW